MNSNLVPSLLSANFYNLENDINVLINNNIKYLHLDVMDGIFVNNISFGIPVIKKLKENLKNNIIFDVHLMITKPERFINEFVNVGADIITVHYEASDDISKAINLIKEKGVKVGLSIKPDTNIKEIIKYLDKVDLVLVMSVNPGFGGQKFIPESLDKINLLYEEREKKKYKYIIEIDGGINKDNINEVSRSGVDLIVAGSAVFNGDIDKNIKSLKEGLC